MILYGKPVAQKIEHEVRDFVKKARLEGKKVKIFLFSDDKPSEVYVNLKKKFASRVWLDAQIVFDPHLNDCAKALELIDEANRDDEVVGIIVQLPLNKHLQPCKPEILAKVAPLKDIDWLWGVLFGLGQVGLRDFLPATPAAVIKILKFYWFWDFEGKKIVVLGQSQLVGAPLASYLISKWAEVISLNSKSPPEFSKSLTRQADIVISATGKVHLIDESWLGNDWASVIVDVGWWFKDGKPAWDVNIAEVKDKVKAYTPVPWGVGPVTVASLFENIKIIHEHIKPKRQSLFQN